MSKSPEELSNEPEIPTDAAGEPAELAEPAVPPEATALLTRAQAARVLGVSVSTVIRRENVLKPVVLNGVHMFDERVLRREVVTVRHRQAIASLGPTSGDVAASVFELLEAGVESTQIVIRLRVTPDAVVALRAQWAEMVRASKCKQCGQGLGVVCRPCLRELFDVPCPTCSRACQKCGSPLAKGKYKCMPCGAWNFSDEKSAPTKVV